MAIDLTNPRSIRTGVRNSVIKALNEVLNPHSEKFADVSAKAISAIWKPAGINRRYFLSFLNSVGDHVNSKLTNGKKLTVRTDMFKASMTFREMLDKLSNLVSKL